MQKPRLQTFNQGTDFLVKAGGGGGVVRFERLCILREKSWLRPLKPSVNKEIKLNFLRLIHDNYLETVCYRFEMTLFQLTVMLTSTPSLLLQVS